MFRRLAIGLSNAGLGVDLVLSSADGPNLADLPDQVRVIDLGARRVRESARPLARYIDSETPDALISTLYYANFVAVAARLLARRSPQLILREATSLSVASSNPGSASHKGIVRLARVLYTRADVVVANSWGAARDLVENVGVPSSMVRVIYNPAYVDEMIGMMEQPVAHPWFLDGGAPLVLSVGRLDPSKRYDLLVRAICLVRQRTPVRLVILGDGPERTRLEALVRELGGQPYVSLPGFVDNPYAYMARADLFALSSAWEGLPNALIEALASGLPVVSTDCPNGPREILGMTSLGTGPVGSLVAPGDADGLAQGIMAELGLRRERSALVERARRFHLDKAVAAYIDLLYPGRMS